VFTLHLHPPLTACVDPHPELPLTISGIHTVRPAKADTITIPSNHLTLRFPLRWAPTIIFKRILSSPFHQTLPRSIPFVHKPQVLALRHRAFHKAPDLHLHSQLHIHTRLALTHSLARRFRTPHSIDRHLSGQPRLRQQLPRTRLPDWRRT
jgi:hypothetical protein